MSGDRSLTRRQVLARAGAGSATLMLGSQGLVGDAGGAVLLRSARGRAVPLPSPARVRADFQRMVDFGPRLTGTGAHHRFVSWLERQFLDAGLDLLPCDAYDIERWTATGFGLRVLDGPGAGPVKVGSYYVRSNETPPGGITAPLVYGGTGPVTGPLPGAKGSIVVVDLATPPPATAGIFFGQSTFRYWPGHNDADWAATDYTRSWVAPGLGVPLAPYEALGAAAVVFILDNISYAALKGAYLPFTSGFEPLPALFVDRDTGAQLRQQALAGQRARFVLTARRKRVATPTATAVLPGASRETIIFNTHTDGQNFAEENGGVAFVHLARHFASLPKAKRLRRTLVFACWPGHMYGDIPETHGWIETHPKLVQRAAAALTVEHLGCREWTDSRDRGYHATGEPETFGVYATQGKVSDLTREAIVRHRVTRSSILRPPPQFGVGGAFQSAGVPQIGAIAGPAYLVTVSPNGEMDKLDERLAARQIAWIADLARRFDRVPAADLRKGDSTLGQPGSFPAEEAPHHVGKCAPAKRPGGGGSQSGSGGGGAGGGDHTNGRVTHQGPS
ncbi:MAG TPA: hypothetical protein VJT75_16370 [Thermoleophilaceae bacterium]|nr:hypothetical protein [Thermoleophilaceae bacterium]